MTSPESNAKMAAALQSGSTHDEGGAPPQGPLHLRRLRVPLVEHQLNANFTKVDPAAEGNEGNVVGQAAWVKSWEEVKAS